jgi:hypothetical protein
MPATAALGRDAMRKGGTQVQVGLFGGEMSFDVGGFATQHKHLLGNFVVRVGNPQLAAQAKP